MFPSFHMYKSVVTRPLEPVWISKPENGHAIQLLIRSGGFVDSSQTVDKFSRTYRYNAFVDERK